jgi:hypothetical protein
MGLTLRVRSNLRKTRKIKKHRKARNTRKQKGGSIPGISKYAVVVNPLKWDD